MVAQNGQSIEIGNACHKRQRIKTKQNQAKNETQCALDTHYPQANTNNVIRHEPLKTTGGKGRTNHRLYAEITTRNPKRKDT